MKPLNNQYAYGVSNGGNGYLGINDQIARLGQIPKDSLDNVQVDLNYQKSKVPQMNAF